MPFVGNTSGGGFRRKQPPATQSSSPDSREAASYTNTDNSHEQGPRNEEGLPLLDGHHTSSRPQRSSGSSNSVVVSPSVRALAALSGSPLPISLQQVEVEATRRRSSLPRSRLRSPSNGLDSSKRSTYPSGTAKTADLIEAFPEPLHQQVRSRCSVPARTSLFPALAALEERSPNVALAQHKAWFAGSIVQKVHPHRMCGYQVLSPTLPSVMAQRTQLYQTAVPSVGKMFGIAILDHQYTPSIPRRCTTWTKLKMSSCLLRSALPAVPRVAGQERLVFSAP
jgi:hypothetical protein